jgi:hypothetical protein
MKHIATLFFAAALLFALPVLGGPTGSNLKDIPLEWKPTETVSTYGAIDLTVYKNAQFIVKPFGDARSKPSEIGQNIEKKFTGQDMIVTTKENVADWLTYNFAKVLSAFEIDVVKSNGSLILEGDIVKFFVTEKSTYKADVALKVRLRSKNGLIVWEGLTSGSATRFGKSYSAENYYEALSNALISAVHALLKNEAFLRAVQQNK